MSDADQSPRPTSPAPGPVTGYPDGNVGGLMQFFEGPLRLPKAEALRHLAGFTAWAEPYRTRVAQWTAPGRGGDDD